VDPEFIRELFAPFRPVTVRRMFGGAAVGVDGITFAIVARGVLYLKVDDASIPAFEQEGSQAFTYTRAKEGAKPGRNKPVSMSYWRLPERLYDDPDELAVWAERAFAIAQRAKVAPRARKTAKVGKAKARAKAATRRR
jgi:DNA transformation protein